MKTLTLRGYILVPANDLDAVKAALPEHIDKTRAEEGCIRFEVTADPNNAARFNVLETFRDREAFEHHQNRTAASDWATVSSRATRHYDITES